MGEWFPNAPDPVNATLDVPADAANATTGTGENLGWFGKIDRALDPRNVDDDEWAEPSGSTSGLSGFFQAGTGATTGLANEGGALTTRPLAGLLSLDDGLPSDDENNDEQPNEQQRRRKQMLLLGLALAAGTVVIMA